MTIQELARYGATVVHRWYFDAAENIDDVPTDGHQQPFGACPHPDCTLVRELHPAVPVSALRALLDQYRQADQGDYAWRAFDLLKDLAALCDAQEPTP